MPLAIPRLMKAAASIVSFFISSCCLAQIAIPVDPAPADSGKHEFLRQAASDTADYTAALRILSNQVKQYPDNAEYRYFLGYAIDRLNAFDGSEMHGLTSAKTRKASEQFEMVNKLQPIYKGESFVLDPYSKLTSIWGSLAMAYSNKGMQDSAKWAFAEGKKRGGYPEALLDFSRQMLNSCDKNAVLVTYGDNISFPAWYLQQVEKFRTDIAIVDVNLLNSQWYPKYLKEEGKLKFGLQAPALDTIVYALWEPQQVTVSNPNNSAQSFTWELKPTYYNYILRGDRILLDIMQQNFYAKPMYFGYSSDSSYNLYLGNHLKDEGLVSRVLPAAINYDVEKIKTPQQLSNYNIDKLRKEDIVKSKEAITVLNGFRFVYSNAIYGLYTQGDHEEAKKLIKEMERKFPKDKLPYASADNEAWYMELFEMVDEDYKRK
jgi:hypothetical protein